MNTSQYFNAKRSKYIKGLAIVLMLFHHLFAFDNRIINVSYVTIGKIGDQTIENYIGIFSRICVPIYLFVSGYGLYYCYLGKNKVKYKDLQKRILNILKIYWVILIVFLLLGIVLGKQQFSVIEFIKNMLTISCSYNQEWWFLNTYIILVLLFPVIKKIIDNTTSKNLIYLILTSFVITLVSGKLLSYNFIMSNEVLKVTLNITAYQSTFILGGIFCNLNIYDKVYHNMKDTYLNNIIIQSSIIFICVWLRGRHNIIDFIMVPVFIYSSIICIEKFKLENVFSYLGKHSTNMWLTHSFFCYYYFKEELFSAKYSLIILGILILLSLMSSYYINYITQSISNIIELLKYKKIRAQ